MEPHPEVTVDVADIKTNDIYTPFDWNRQNLVRWVMASLTVYAVYDVCFSPANHLAGLPDGESLAAVLVTLGVFIVLGLTVFPYLRLHALMRKAPGFRETVQFVFTAEGLRFSSKNASGQYKWSVFARVIETKKSFMLSQTGYSGTYVPKRCFQSKPEVETVRQLIRENFKGKWTLRREA